MFSDEAHFCLSGFVSIPNCHYQSKKNAQVVYEVPLHSEKLTVWCGLWRGPYWPLFLSRWWDCYRQCDKMSNSSLDEFDEDVALCRRNFNDRSDQLVIYPGTGWQKKKCMDLYHLIGSGLESITHRYKFISAELQILITLRFFAMGGFQILVGNDVRIRKSTVCIFVKKVTCKIHFFPWWNIGHRWDFST